MVSYSYWVSFAWGLALLLSFAGWGAAVARVAGVAGEDRDWALCACWGMATVTALGGTLALFNLANGSALIAITVVGWYLAAVWLRGGASCANKRDWGAPLIFALTLIIWYAPSVASRDVEPYDDYLAYFPFARRFLDTGTLIEPFSYRRLLSYGGQSLLDAMTMAVGSEKAAHLLDSGIAMLILGALVYRPLRAAFETKRNAFLWAVLGSIAVLLVPIARHNVASQATGLIRWIAVFRTLQLKSRPMVPAGLLLAALCSLRSNYVVGVVLLAAGLLVGVLSKNKYLSLPEYAKLIASACAAAAAWAILCYRSSGSLLYPLFKGYQTAGMSSSYQTPWTAKAQAVLHFAVNPSVLFLLVPLVLCVILVRGWHMPFSIAAIVLALAVPWSAPLTEQAGLFRYVQPLAWGSLLIAASAFIKARRNVAVPLALLMSPVWMAYAAIAVKQSVASVSSLPSQIADNTPPYSREQLAEYKGLNAALPAGASVFAIVPLPSALDYRTHRIFNADFIAFASLPPGLPFFRGPGELKQYLLSQGIDYIAYNDFDHPSVETGYWRTWWRDRASTLKPDFAPVVPYVLDVMKNVDALASSENTTFRSGDLRVIHLTKAQNAASVQTAPLATTAPVPPNKRAD